MLSTKIENFILWLEATTDFDDWNPLVKKEVHRKLIEIMTEKEEMEHDWEFDFNGTFCKRCGAQIGSGFSCK